MKFLPIENIKYKSKLNEEELFKRLSNLVEPVKAIRFGILSNKETKPYEGQIIAKSFIIRRISDYKSIFLPIINGVIQQEDDGIAIKIKMRLSTGAIIFLCVWFGIGALIFIGILPQFFKAEFNPALLIPVGVLLFGYIVTVGRFKFEGHRSKKELREIFEAEIISTE